MGSGAFKMWQLELEVSFAINNSPIKTLRLEWTLSIFGIPIGPWFRVCDAIKRCNVSLQELYPSQKEQREVRGEVFASFPASLPGLAKTRII